MRCDTDQKILNKSANDCDYYKCSDIRPVNFPV